MKPTIHLDLANFRLYSNGQILNRENRALDIQSQSESEARILKRVKSTLSLVRMGYNEDGAERIGVKSFFINSDCHNKLKEVLLFQHRTKGLNNVKIKYKKIELLGSPKVSDGEIHGG